MPLFLPPSLQLLRPEFDSPLLGLIIDLEKLRERRLRVTTPGHVFLQLKEVFHLLESLGSARIEGNHTTISDLVEHQISPESVADTESMREIRNMNNALAFIEQNVPGSSISNGLILRLHEIVVHGLSQEGDPTPGQYRSVPIKISGASHIPPPFGHVQRLMDELFQFIQRDEGKQYHLMKMALAHHAFTWIHPFRNGNGRTVRLLTYAMLIKQHFNVNSYERILNPTAIFCNDRSMYYRMLSLADSGSANDLEAWCTYVLGGLKTEIEKVDQLANVEWLQAHIWHPAIQHTEQKGLISSVQARALRAVFNLHRPFKASDLIVVVGGDTPSSRTARSRLIRSLSETHLIQPVPFAERSYIINISKRSVLLRGIIDALEKQGFIPQSLFA